ARSRRRPPRGAGGRPARAADGGEQGMIFWTLELGRYNWASTEDVWCLTLRTPYGQVSETFPKDAKPDVDPEWTTPSEVIDIIEARLDSYWFSTRRAETKAKIAEIRQHSNEIDAAWLDQQIKQVEDRLRILRSNREALEEASND